MSAADERDELEEAANTSSVVLAGEVDDAPELCTGETYLVNPAAPEEGTDVHHVGPCPVHPTELRRQSCRGHLERGLESYTVGTLPSGETRPYRTEVLDHVSGARRLFHYCEECSSLPEFADRLERSEVTS